jgi:hypothetical protein
MKENLMMFATRHFIKLGCIVLFSLIVSLSSIAQTVDVPDGFIRDAALSEGAVAEAQVQFTSLKFQLEELAKTLPPDQAALVNQAIAMIEDKLNNLDRIDVYRPSSQETSPGEAYDTVYDFYKTRLTDWHDIENNQIEIALPNVPPNLIPPETLASLNDVVDEGFVRAAGGQSGASKVSISTVYIDYPDKMLVKGTTIVIATEK